MSQEGLHKALVSIVGSERVFCDPATLEPYSQDMTENEPSMPGFVVKPDTVEEIQAIVKLANARRVPITPVVANTNVGGLALPAEGGIVMDLKGMNRILDVNTTEMYALIEPGVTFGQMREYLDMKHPDLTMGYPLSPPYASVMCNCLLDGLSNLSLRFGSTSELINGLEVVLPTGEVVRVGAPALSPLWFARGPLPDLAGLFVNWQGATGIVTKMAVQLWPKPRFRRRMFLLAYEADTPFEMLRRFSRTMIFDDLGALSWPLGKMLFGIHKPLEKDPDEPEFFIYIDVPANTQAEMKAKNEIIGGVIEEFRKQGATIEGPLDIDLLLRVDPSLKRFGEFPMTLDFLLDHPGKGLTWVGTYGPTEQWEEGTKRGRGIMLKHGFPPVIVARPMKSGHFAVLRFIVLFDKSQEEDLTRARRVNEELCDLVLDLGFIPYKAPRWMVERFQKRLDPAFIDLMKRIKQVMDPNRVMNPGRWLL